ncbi:Hypothetical predicted protein [Mytilus galloprovincialis]|uniref:Uncharacterized protein n=1 Tax=Mytilus galloprovincialis TaxID=29158 RepID=A0A8B6FQR0_MYTGA|nr:Hypothetical predicted protein [Mytilus galloprovincialis]
MPNHKSLKVASKPTPVKKVLSDDARAKMRQHKKEQVKKRKIVDAMYFTQEMNPIINQQQEKVEELKKELAQMEDDFRNNKLKQQITKQKTNIKLQLKLLSALSSVRPRYGLVNEVPTEM